MKGMNRAEGLGLAAACGGRSVCERENESGAFLLTLFFLQLS